MMPRLPRCQQCLGALRVVHVPASSTGPTVWLHAVTPDDRHDPVTGWVESC